MTIEKAIELWRTPWTAEKVKFCAEHPVESEAQLKIIKSIRDSALDLYEACEACASASIICNDGSIHNELYEAREKASLVLEKISNGINHIEP